jgi:hypothetical protein
MKRATKATPAGVPRSRAKRTREQRKNPLPHRKDKPTAWQRRWWREVCKGVDSHWREMQQVARTQAHKHGGTHEQAS